MKGLIYYISLPFIYLLSILPFPVLYRLSDLFYFILYSVFGYRKKVALQNLRNSFPEKPETEIRKLCRQYYRYLCDLFLETFKTLTIRPSTMLKRCTLSPAAKDIFDGYHREGKSIMLVMGHYGNWEWAGNTFSLTCKQQLFVVYHPFGNTYFNGLMVRMRTRFGTGLIAMKDTYKEMVKNKSMITTTAFIADQTPQPDNAFWTSFLNQDTPVFRGTEKIAKKMDYPIVYITIKRLKRGYYNILAEVLTEDAKNTAEGEISGLHTTRLEKDIREQPEIWLWTHRRWKHKRPAEIKSIV
ncbi:lysophospholipid acyltransferase family protein [Longitalea arenae]|uniref:lysophospholipid acyltransferase family protein n=1 Tax=Longitalea arenae TaxID=2812558 RepID=UPI001967A531|nr:lysophospholipid acyltransferase family protein [Longitalea arenae]